MRMIEQVCAYIHNYFHGDRYHGRFAIEDGVLTVDGLVDGQYFQICGSKFNDGVHTYPSDDLVDETFEGVIWEMRPPRLFLKLVDEISTWNDKYGSVAQSPYSSESFNGYSYQKAQNYASSGGGFKDTWQTIFGSQLNQWRKLA